MARNPDKKRCGAKRRNGEPCQQWGMANGRCRLHGGNAKRGLRAPALKHGRYSKDIPVRFADQLKRALEDNDTLNLTDEIGIKTVRIGELLKRVDTGESGALWSDLKTAWTEFRDAQAKRDTIAMNQIMREIDTLVTRGYNDSAVWREISFEIDARRKLVDTERRRRIDMQTMITSEKAGAMMFALTETVMRHVNDPAILDNIIADFRAITHTGGDRSTQPET